MIHSLLLGKTIIKAARLMKRSGSTWPGHLALKADPHVIKKFVKKNPHLKFVFIAGTNGKTTTTKALTHILTSYNIKTITNDSGANLLNGLASLLVTHANWKGKLSAEAIIFEVDENSLPLVLKQIPHPHAIVLLNLFRDQLDRYGEVNATAEKWKKSIEMLDKNTLVVGNADDPQIAHITAGATNKTFFTIDNTFKNRTTLSHAVDSTTCPRCQNQLHYSKIAYSHVGNYECQNCSFSNPKAKFFSFSSSLLGNYNLYNLSAAILACDKIFGINPYTSGEFLKTFTPAFGRQEMIDINGKKMMLLLSKNPTGFNESIDVALQSKSDTILILLNDRIPDGRDISWIWDVDFEKLQGTKSKVIVSGDRAYDMANRLYFADIAHHVYDTYTEAIKKITNDVNGKTITVLPTYSAMLEVRKLISGKSIL